ncbi:MAG TPA: flagellar basal body protein [Solirubrobacteraceae bacterium]|jgi:flagellar basal-body rod protein FlgB|nr:flagellar basal body protein [Solirubrobacteraceae bacterium]
MAIVDSTQQLLEAAMRGAWQRQTALTNNIANADTPGYQPQEVNFESALQGAINGGQAPAEVQFQTVTRSQQVGPNGTGVSVDEESAKLAENGLDYQALTQVMGVRNTIMRSAMGAPPV